MKTALIFALVVLLAAPLFAAGEPVRIIYDTDMGNDVDDAIGLALLHALETRGEAKLLAVTITKDNKYSAPFVDLMNTFYGRPDIPIGIVKDGKTKQDGSYTKAVVEKTGASGQPLYPRRLMLDGDVPDATAVLRQTLAAQPDGSVTIVQVGFSTNLARLLDSQPDATSRLSGRELAAKKVKLLVLMAGRFVDDKPEYNIEMDIPSAQKLFSQWPTPLITSPWEVGDAIKYPAGWLNDFRWAEAHPLVDAYKSYQKMPYAEPLWDPTAVLYAVRPDAGYFGVGREGQIKVDEHGVTSMEFDEGEHHFLTAEYPRAERIREAIALLMSQPIARK